ncbi:cytochrome [Amycolatopsis coloradensis]|uniref:Cytochrome n=2 Tax=Amycolatopsis coloradensis TaxID=76021 RepID=A0A1R0KUJ3_9PSEU|nr:cytochrome [Amycolatopsis coloradensis]
MAALVSPQVRANPYPLFGQMREGARVAKLTETFALVTGFAEATQLLGSQDFGHPEPEKIVHGDPAQHDDPDHPVDAQGRVVRAFLSLNPPDHTRLRGLVAKAFNRRVVEGLTPRIEELVADSIGQAIEQGEADLMSALAVPLPVAVISEMLGVPLADRERFAAWSTAMARALDPAALLPPEVAEAIAGPAQAARREFIAYFRDLAAERRRNPADDLLSRLVTVSDEDGDRLSEGELLVTLTMLLVAGHETTTNLIGNGVLALLRHPDQYTALARDETLIDGAIEETLRYDPPVQLTQRTVLTDTTLGGVDLPAGASAIVLIGAANRDPQAHPDPDTFDITRTPNRHLAFGHGVHFCLGAPLARLEARIALRELARRAPKLTLAGDPDWARTVTLRGLASLPVTLN